MIAIGSEDAGAGGTHERLTATRRCPRAQDAVGST